MTLSPFETDPLPGYEPSTLALLDEQQLIELMIDDEDRVPRNVIDECARRGDAMLEKLRPVIGSDAGSNLVTSGGEWWLELHAAFILGRMTDDAAGRLLLDFMRRLAREEDENLEDWLAGVWPALFANKSDTVLREVEAFAFSAFEMPYMRPSAIEVVLAARERRGPQALDATLDRVAAWISDESRDPEERLLAASVLLDFPRVAHRALLEELADAPEGSLMFDRQDIADAYEAARDTPGWLKIDDPWHFYDPTEIASRQQRWREEAEQLFEDYGQDLPYVRETPKIGRNDPCPCGSGRKYKKCCLG